MAGTHYIVLTLLGMKIAINAVFEAPDDVKDWFGCLYFLIKATMRAHSVAISECVETKE